MPKAATKFDTQKQTQKVRLVAGTISAPLVNPGKKIISILFALFFFGSLCTQNEWFRSTKCVLSYYLLKREVIKEITTVRSAEKTMLIKQRTVFSGLTYSIHQILKVILNGRRFII